MDYGESAFPGHGNALFNSTYELKKMQKQNEEYGLIAKGTRKYYRYQANKTAYDEKDNILNQVFSTKAKNEIWVGDITYIPTKHGWLYLAVFICFDYS